MNTELDQFKALLPDTWAPRVFPSTPDCIIVDVPRDEGGGSMTINPKRRWWCPGMFTRPHSLSHISTTWYGVDLYGGDDRKRYKGRGWRSRLVEDINRALAIAREIESGGTP